MHALLTSPTMLLHVIPSSFPPPPNKPSQLAFKDLISLLFRSTSLPCPCTPDQPHTPPPLLRQLELKLHPNGTAQAPRREGRELSDIIGTIANRILGGWGVDSLQVNMVDTGNGKKAPVVVVGFRVLGQPRTATFSFSGNVGNDIASVIWGIVSSNFNFATAVQALLGL